ncbi:MAG: FISUMP domain-containing protein [Dysgonomonas sp.]|nr:FISUMP domain-containing protein [Dysgonomonas sp.]
MNALKTTILLAIIVLGGQAATLNAQVTIGSGNKPNRAAILDLKEWDAQGANSNRGLALPRVNLTEADKLYPMFTAGYDANLNKTHAGLTVYNTNLCAPFGTGAFTWSGSRWEKLVEGPSDGLDISLSADILYLPSGEDLRTLANPYNFDVSWSGATGPTWSLGAWKYNNPGSNISLTPASLLGASSPQTMELAVKTFYEYDSNWLWDPTSIPNYPFNTYQQEIVFADKCGSKSMLVNQTNKAMSVNATFNYGNNSMDLTPVNYIGNATSVTITVQSNARWNITLSPAEFTPIALTGGFESGQTYGTELYNNTSVSTQVTYDLTAGTHFDHNADIIFSDSETPMRFAPIVYKVKQCNSITSEITMRQWVDVWEDMYGLDDANDEPDSDGDTTKNTNRVQWHIDQDGNYFFSALFNGVRWMTSNLAATSFVPTLDRTATDTDIRFDFDHGNNNYPSPYEVGNSAPYAYPLWSYPGIDEDRYKSRERLGLLYNWAAATNSKAGDTGKGNVDGSKTNEGKFPENTSNTAIADTQKRRQGICPAGWHLPSDLELINLCLEILNNTTQYADVSSNIGGTSGSGAGLHYGEVNKAITDVCEEPDDLVSKTLLHGGFNVLLAGFISANSSEEVTNVSAPGTLSMLWTSSSHGSSTAYASYIDGTRMAVRQGYGKNQMFSVRCVKD